MLRPILALLLCGATAFAAPAAKRSADSEEQRLNRQLAGLVAGEPQSCITPSPSEGTPHAGRTVLIRDRVGTLYRSDLGAGCNARENDALITRTPSSQLCRGDIVEFRDLTAGFTSGSCIFGDFVPYRKPK